MKHGYDGTSMTAIADAVGVRPATLYHHFPSKNRLLYAFLEDVGQRLMEVCVKAVADAEPKPDARLKAFVRAHAVFELEMLDVMPFVDINVFRASSFASALSDEQHKALSQRQRRLVDIVKRILRDGFEAGHFTYRDLNVATYAIIGSIEHLVFWYRKESALTPEDVADDLAEIAVRSVRTASNSRENLI